GFLERAVESGVFCNDATAGVRVGGETMGQRRGDDGGVWVEWLGARVGDLVAGAWWVWVADGVLLGAGRGDGRGAEVAARAPAVGVGGRGGAGVWVVSSAVREA